MRVVADGRTLGSRPSGVGMCAFGFLREMIKYDCELIVLSDVAESEEMQWLKKQGVRIITYGRRIYRSGSVFAYFNFVKRNVLELQPDVFWEPNALIAGNLKGFHGKIAVTLHDMFPITQPECFSFLYRIYFRLILKKTIRIADTLIYNSEETKHSTETCFPEAKKKKNFIGYIIMDSENLSCDVSLCSKEIQDLAQGDYFLYVGNMEKRKGVDILLAGYEKYVESGGGAALYLVGKRREKDIDVQIDEAVRNLHKLRYVGYVGEQEKKFLLKNCSAFVFPSRAEGFGIGVLEAMQYGKPVIASDLSIFKEIVGESIHYFEMAGTAEEQAERLASQLREYHHQIDSVQYAQCLNRYSAEVLGKRFVEILDE